jgi:hypothetical protein
MAGRVRVGALEERRIDMDPGQPPNPPPPSQAGPAAGTSRYLSLSQAARTLPGHTHPSTLWRWINKGVAGVRLRAVRIGRRVFTTQTWIEDFIQSCTAAGEAPATHKPFHPAKTTSHLAAEAALDAAGI